MPKKIPSKSPAPKPEEVPGMRSYLAAIGSAGGKASGESRRIDRAQAEAGDPEALAKVAARSALASKAIRARWDRKVAP